MGVSTKLVPFVVFIIVAILEKQAFATTHVVGDSQGWDTSTDLSSWASKKTFRVGDELEFKYTTGLHNLVEVADENAYKSCDISTPLKTSTSGDDKIKLTKTGTRFFTCGTPSHCGDGMKVKINIVAADGGSSAAAAVTPQSSSGATPSTSPSFHKVRFFSLFALVASLVVSFI